MNTSHMARWNRAHGRCGDRRRKRERRAISEEDPPQPSLGGRGAKLEEDMSLDVLLTSAVLCIALVLIWASLKDE